MSPIDLTGKSFGNLTVIKRSDLNSRDGSIIWVVYCSVCLEYSLRDGTELRRGRHNCPYCLEVRSKNSPYRVIYNTYMRNAEKLNRVFDLTFDQFKSLIRDNCHYCGVSPVSFVQKKNGKYGAYYNGVDRVDNSIGYLPENCVTCCRFCNFAKSRFGLEEFEAWLTYVRGSAMVDTH